MTLWTETAIKVSFHPTKLNGHRHSDSRDVFSLSRDLIRPKINDLICGSPSWYVTILPSLVAIGTVVVEVLRKLQKKLASSCRNSDEKRKEKKNN